MTFFLLINQRREFRPWRINIDSGGKGTNSEPTERGYCRGQRAAGRGGHFARGRDVEV